MRRLRHSLVPGVTAAAVTLVLLACLCTRAAADTPTQDPPASAPTARATVEEATGDALAALRDPNLTRADKGRRVRQVAAEHIDFETLSRLSLGQAWRDLSPGQRTQFVQEFRKHILGLYRGSIDEYTNESVVVTGDNPEARGDWTVQTRIVGRKRVDGTPRQVATVIYRLRQKDGRWKAIDVTVDGISVAAIFRSQFQAILTTSGPERLLQLLREKNAAAEQADGGSSNAIK